MIILNLFSYKKLFWMHISNHISVFYWTFILLFYDILYLRALSYSFLSKWKTIGDFEQMRWSLTKIKSDNVDWSSTRSLSSCWHGFSRLQYDIHLRSYSAYRILSTHSPQEHCSYNEPTPWYSMHVKSMSFGSYGYTNPYAYPETTFG